MLSWLLGVCVTVAAWGLVCQMVRAANARWGVANVHLVLAVPLLVTAAWCVTAGAWWTAAVYTAILGLWLHPVPRPPVPSRHPVTGGRP